MALYSTQKTVLVWPWLSATTWDKLWFLSLKTTLPFTAVEVEAMAARRALNLALETGIDRVILEGDSQILITALETSPHSLSPFGHIANDTVPCLVFLRNILFPCT